MARPSDRAKALAAQMKSTDFVCVRMSPATDRDEMMGLLEEHFDFLIALEKSGYLFLSGPLLDTDGAPFGEGMTILRGLTLDEARDKWADEPFCKAGLREPCFQTWRVNEGRISLSFDFSDGQIEIG